MKHHDAIDLLITVLAVVGIILACLFILVFIANAKERVLWSYGDQLPGYPTDCTSVCYHNPVQYDDVLAYIIVAEKSEDRKSYVIARTIFHVTHVQLHDLTWTYGTPIIQLGDNYAVWHNLQGYSPIPINLRTIVEDGVITYLDITKGE